MSIVRFATCWADTRGRRQSPHLDLDPTPEEHAGRVFPPHHRASTRNRRMNRFNTTTNQQRQRGPAPTRELSRTSPPRIYVSMRPTAFSFPHRPALDEDGQGRKMLDTRCEQDAHKATPTKFHPPWTPGHHPLVDKPALLIEGAKQQRVPTAISVPLFQGYSVVAPLTQGGGNARGTRVTLHWADMFWPFGACGSRPHTP